MPSYSHTSRERLLTCHPDLQKVFFAVIQAVDCTISCGYRGQAEQDAAFQTGNSKERYPNSRHNSNPSQAVDVYPCPIDWKKWEKDKGDFIEFAKVVKTEAEKLNIKLEWGGDWIHFKDYPHWQLPKG